jgi:hypothetical protein
VTGGWRKLHIEELRNLYSCRVWAGNVARMGMRRTCIGYWWESQRERDHYDDQDIGGWLILRLIFERYEGVILTRLIWLTTGISVGLF